MSEPFTLRWKLDRPYLEHGQAGDVYALVSIDPVPTADTVRLNMPVHLLLLVDVSGSMDFLIRFDPQAQKIGSGVTEGRAAQRVLSSIPSRREMVCGVVRKLAERLGNEDRLTLAAFDDKPYLLAQAVSPREMDRLFQAVVHLGQVGGGGTNLSKGLGLVRQVLNQVPNPEGTRKLVLLTDGEDDDPVNALLMARKLSEDFHLPIVALGTGECKVAFLSEIARTTLSGSFNHITHEHEADRLFHQVLAGQKNVQATRALLKFWFSPDIQVRELYRTRPEILFLGDLQPDGQNLVTLHLEQLEMGRGYEFLFRCTLPARKENQRLRIAKASLSFSLPVVDTKPHSVESNIVMTYTDNPQRAKERSGDVRRVLARAEIQRQVLFLQEKIDAITRGQAGDRDRALVANLLQGLIKKFTEMGDQAQANQYRAMQEEFTRRGAISQEMLNRSLAASSRAEELIVAQDIDF